MNNKNLETLQKEYDDMLLTRENLTMYIISRYLSLKESIYSDIFSFSYRIIMTKVSNRYCRTSVTGLLTKAGYLLLGEVLLLT